MNIVIIMSNKYAMYMVEKVYSIILDYVILCAVKCFNFVCGKMF